MTDEILIEPETPLDLNPQEVEELRQLIQTELGVKARQGVREVPPGTVGVTWSKLMAG